MEIQTENKKLISLSHLSKTFKIHIGEDRTARQQFVNLFKKGKIKEYKALNNISLDIYKGDFIGMVGRNGSGKSTMLKVIAGIYEKDNDGGKLEVNGSIVPFLELGVGFNEDLSGRENIFLNGTILGMPRSYLEKVFDTIVEFAELEDFIDEPVKNYSSGMLVRLAFSIAIRADADIYILDEILAVGDSLFQQKSEDVIRELVKEGKTILFVSHSTESIRKFCNRVVWIEKGKVKYIGETEKGIKMYENSLIKREQEEIQKRLSTETNQDVLKTGSKEVVAEKLDVRVGKDNSLSISIDIKHNKHVEKLNCALGFYSAKTNANVFTLESKNHIKLDTNTIKINAETGPINLNPGKYYINIALFGDKEEFPYYWEGRIGVFSFNNLLPENVKPRALIYLESEWKLK